jgi:hypothetical protein
MPLGSCSNCSRESRLLFLFDFKHRFSQGAAQSAINHQSIPRRRQHRLRRCFAVNITRKDRLKNIRVVFVGNGVNFSLEISLRFLGAEFGSLLPLPTLYPVRHL